METTDTLPKVPTRVRNSGPEQIELRRTMTPEQVKERASLNVKNTAESIAKRAERPA